MPASRLALTLQQQTTIARPSCRAFSLMNSEAKRYALKHSGHSWSQICQLQGRDRQAAMAVWQWSAVRFSSLGTDQDRYFKRYGAARAFERINRVRVWLGLEALA